MRIIGAADEFWRVRLSRLDTAEGLDFEWHEDILYREPRVQGPRDVETWNVQALALDGSDRVVHLAAFQDRAKADEYLERAETDLHELTKSQFEDAYLAPAEASDAEDDSRES